MHRDRGAEEVYFSLCSLHRALQMRWSRPEVTFYFGWQQLHTSAPMCHVTACHRASHPPRPLDELLGASTAGAASKSKVWAGVMQAMRSVCLGYTELWNVTGPPCSGTKTSMCIVQLSHYVCER